MNDKFSLTNWDNPISQNCKKFINVYGMKRSGHHAIIHWLIRQCPEVAYYNNNHGMGTVYGDNPVWLFTSIEDKIPEADGYVVFRDPYNWLASCLKSTHSSLSICEINKVIEQYVAVYNSLNPKIYFNRWSSDKEYRRSIIETLGWQFTDLGYEEVERHCWGSSFDKFNYHGKASQMKVLYRWEHFKDNKYYLNFFTDYPELIDIGNDLGFKCPILPTKYTDDYSHPFIQQPINKNMTLHQIKMALNDMRFIETVPEPHKSELIEIAKGCGCDRVKRLMPILPKIKNELDAFFVTRPDLTQTRPIITPRRGFGG